MTYRHIKRSVFLAAVALSMFGSAAPAPAASIWTGANSEDWTDGGNWVGGVPGNGADVIITNAVRGMQLAADSAGLASLSISSNTLTFVNWSTTLNCTNVTIQAGGTFALPGEFGESDMSNRVHVACVALTIEKGGVIDADGAGFKGWDGPGGGSHSVTLYASGGSYGGKGGAGKRGGTDGLSVPAAPYGTPSQPLDPGSGGGSHSSHRDKAGAGGGAVYIDASGTVTVNGTVSADGNPAKNITSGYYAAGGSGGGVAIVCGTFGGGTNGLIRARGGDAYNLTAAGGAGGGGRIAVDYTSLSAEHRVRFATSPGNDWALQDLDHRWYQRPHAGTLWVPDTALLDSTLSEEQFQDVRIVGLASWTLSSLSVSNCAVEFAEDGFALTVTGDLRIDSGGVLGIGSDSVGGQYTLSCGGNLVLTNGGSLFVYSGVTNDAGPGYGALVEVTNAITVGPSSRIYPACHHADGGAPRFVAGSVTVAPGGGINADAKGFGFALGPGVGGTGISGGTYPGGAGHGGGGGGHGAGGTDSEGGGDPYGSVSVPLLPGSGGSCHSGHTNSAGTGGGVVWIEAAGTVTVGGTVSADGGDGHNRYGAGGSGGSVYIKCDTFGGPTNGLLSVRGGSIPVENNPCGGGGGRIAVDYQNAAATRAVRFTAAPAEREWATVEGEQTYIAFRAKAGTLWLPGTDLLDATLSEGQFDDVRVFGPTSWSPATLSVSNCVVTFAEPGFALDVAGGILVGAGGQLGVGDYWAGSNYVLRCGGGVTLTNGGALRVYAGQTNGTGQAHGILVGVTNALAVGPSSWVHPYCHGTDGAAPRFTVGSLAIAAGGGINADSGGYASWYGPGTGLRLGERCGGAGYGGRGGASSDTVEGGYPYGSVHMPLAPGSGGGAYVPNRSRWGGQGGGSVWVETAGAVSIDGTVTANGCPGREQYAGGGSGGGVYIKCSSFGGASSGLLRADGGDGRAFTSASGGGGGGRIAVDYDSLAATRAVRFSVAPADVSYAFTDMTNKWQLVPRVGTVSLSDGGMLTDTFSGSQFPGEVSLFFQDVSSWAVDSLTVSNCWVAFGQDNFQVTVSNDVLVDTGGALGLGHYHDGSNYTLAVGGSLILTNGGELHVYGGLTNAMGEGDVSAVVTVTNDLVMRSGAWIYPSSHDLDGGSPVFRMRDLLLDAGAGFNANGKGYRSRKGPGAGGNAAATKNGGGGYGGKGGASDGGARPGGVTYGFTNGPALPGSGGGTYATTPQWDPRGGAGAGPVRIEARGDVNVSGTITADGGDGLYHQSYSAGASGGGIYILCNAFSGGAQALMRADGGNAYNDSTAFNGGGGGGRVTVWQNVAYDARTNHLAGGTVPGLIVSTVFANYDGLVSVTNGIGALTDPAQPGTAYFLRQAAGNAFEFRVEGNPDRYDTPTPHGYATHLDVPENTRITNSVTTPFDEGGGLRRACLGFLLEDYDSTLISNGTAPQVIFDITTNTMLTWYWTNEWQLTTAYEANGTVNWSVVDGWYTNAVNVTNITAFPDGGFLFNGWVGDVPLGRELDNPLTVTMDEARWITGTFAIAVRETNTWSGTGTWETVTNWSLGKLPKSIDDVVVGSGLLIADASKYVSSVTVGDGATLLFTNWTTRAYVAEDVVVQSNGVITCAGPFTNSVMSNRVDISCSNLTVEAGGRIDVLGKGFDGQTGPGAGGFDLNVSHSGGAYGGRGGHGRRNGGDTPESVTYGSAAQPLAPGSGGGSHANHGPKAGAGGGAVLIDAAGTVTVDGTIIADGAPSTGQHAAGGSGGGIYIMCDVFGGNRGVVRALGGDAYPAAADYYGGGGGGRIAVDYGSLAAQHDVQFSAGPAEKDWGRLDEDNRWPHAARMGTLWLPDTNLLVSPVTDNLFSNCCLVVDGVTSLALDSLTVSNAAFTFGDSGFELHIANDLVIGPNGSLGIGDYYGGGSNYLLACGGSITLTNGGALHVYAGETNGVAGDDGALVLVTNDIVIGPSSWLYPYCGEERGGTPRFSVADLWIASGGGINAAGRGYVCTRGPGVGEYISSESGGGGYGGLGGSSQEESYGGPTYGSVHMPILPGSGGGSHPGHTLGGGTGGGAVRLQASGTVSVDGTIAADGTESHNQYGGGGSGGSVYLQCDTFGGSGGLIRADGGDTISTNNAGAGGGGRIAVDYSSLAATHDVAFSAEWGAKGWPRAAHVLEHRWHHRAQAGTLSLSDLAMLSGTLTDGHFAGPVRLYFPALNSWSPPSLTVSNCSVTLAQDGFQLNVANELRIDGGSLGIGSDPAGSNYAIRCGDLVVTNGGELYVHAGLTNNGAQAYGTVVSVAQDIAVGPASWIHPIAHQVNGATVLFKARDVSVAEGGGFNANAKGYQSRLGPGHATIVGAYAGGSGFGGRGGDSSTGIAGGPTYGATNAPVQPGSGGGSHDTVNYRLRGGGGGGSVRVDASGRFTLLGTVTANGGKGFFNHYGGGGSGGGINLFTGRFYSGPNALLSAEGGDGKGNAGAGGGGRIAVWERITEAQRPGILAGGSIVGLVVSNALDGVFLGAVSVTNGTGAVSANLPELGTVRYVAGPRSTGTVIMVR